MENNLYYVYKHTFKNNYFYIGKGKGNRALEFKKGRPRNYLEDLEKYGIPAVTFIHEGLSEEDAYKIENELITQARSNGENIHNRTDGLEKLDIGNMPWRSLIFNKQKSPPKYNQIVHLSSTKNSGSYCLAATIIEAAIKMKCTCNEVLDFINSVDNGGVNSKNDYRLMSEEEVFQIVPEYKDQIIKMTNEAIAALEASK